MSVDKLDVWNDSRIQRRSAFLNGKTYGERLKFSASIFPFLKQLMAAYLASLVLAE